MNSNRNDRTNAYRQVDRDGRSSYPEEGYDSRYGTAEDEPYPYGEIRRFEYDRDQRRASERGYSTRGSGYGSPASEYSDDGPGYSTANDFSGQEPVRGRLHGSPQRSEYDQEDYGRYREGYKRGQYPETYRSAMSGYISQHVGDDSGRKDYNQRPGEGNLYGNRYGWRQSNTPGRYWPSQERGYMSEDDYDRGTPFSGGGNMSYGRSYAREWQEEGPHKGKGPRNYRRADSRIHEDINVRLTDDPLVDASEVDVAVQNGEVTLSGTVDDRLAKRRAEDIAESVSGVTQVQNRMKVRLAVHTNPPPVTPY